MLTNGNFFKLKYLSFLYSLYKIMNSFKTGLILFFTSYSTKNGTSKRHTCVYTNKFKAWKDEYIKTVRGQ